MEQYNCNQGDVGNPIAHTYKALEDGLKAVSETPLKTKDGGTLGPINSVLMNMRMSLRHLYVLSMHHQKTIIMIRLFRDSCTKYAII